MEPLFVTSLDLLQEKLRLSSVEQQEDAQRIIEEAVLTVRNQIYTALGASRISDILATPFTESPVSEAEYVRALAATTEVKAVRLELIRVLPLAFADAGKRLFTAWQDEGFTRGVSKEQLGDEISRLHSDVLRAFAALKTGTLQNSSSRVKASCINPAETPPSLWGKVFS